MNVSIDKTLKKNLFTHCRFFLLLQQGVLEKIQKKYVPLMPGCEQDDLYKAATFEDVQTAFVMIAISYILGTIICENDF